MINKQKNPDSHVHRLYFGTITGIDTAIVFPFVPFISAIKVSGGNISAETPAGIVVLKNLPHAAIAACNSENGLLLVGIDAYDRPQFSQRIWSNSVVQNTPVLKKNASKDFEVLINKSELITLCIPTDEINRKINIYFSRLMNTRSKLKLQTIESPFASHINASRSEHENLINSLIGPTVLTPSHKNLPIEDVSTMALYHDLGRNTFNFIFSAAPSCGRSIVTSSCLIGSGIPLRIALSADSMFLNSFSDVFAALTYASIFGGKDACLAVYKLIEIKASNRDFGKFSLCNDSRDSKDALYMVTDIFEDEESLPKTSIEIANLSLKIASRGLGEWMHRHGVDLERSIARTFFTETVIEAFRSHQ